MSPRRHVPRSRRQRDLYVALVAMIMGVPSLSGFAVAATIAR
jgi:hypothetical protein